MTEDSLPTDEFDTEWHNYGDVNPEIHGGRFVRWDGEREHFEIISTDRQEVMIADLSDEKCGPGHYVIRQTQVYVDDIWVNGNPGDGFTKAVTEILESLQATNHFEAPAGPPFINRIEYYVADMPFHMDDSDYQFVDGDYEDILEDYGIEDWE